MTRNIKVVFFDVDDTLFDRVTAHRLAVEIVAQRFPRLFQGINLDIIYAAWQEADRLSMLEFNSGAPSEGLRDALSRKFLRLLGLPENSAETITATYVGEYPLINTPVPGVIETLKSLLNHFKLGIISNGFPDVQYRKLQTLGIREYFSCVVLSEEFGIRKPDPRIFRHAADLMKVHPAECLYVGDDYDRDITGAKSSEMTAVWFRPGYSLPLDKDCQADFVISRMAELVEHLAVSD